MTVNNGSGSTFLSGITIGEGGNSNHTAIFTPRSAVLPEPVMTLQPTVSSLVCALDIAPSAGAVAQNANGFAWIDVVDSIIQNISVWTGTSARVGNGGKVSGAQVADFSSRAFNGATAIPVVLAAGWDGSSTPQIFMSPQSSANKNVLIGFDGSDVFTGAAAAPATTATRGGFLYLSTCAGAPTGVPAQVTAAWSALRYDSTNHKLWVWDTVGAAWKGVVLA